MSLSNIDKSRALRTEDELRDLVAAIHDSPPSAQETNWLEWKSGLDLRTAEGRFAVAKAILGFSNRSVAQAQLALEGLAYMVIGAEPGAANGVPTFDHATLGQRIKTYADGPRWTPYYIEFSGAEVLVIVVESPRAGDPIHTLQKEFSNDKTRHKAGTVFHRGAAHTEPAGPKEVQMLGERLLHGVRQPDLDLALVSAIDRPLTRLEITTENLNDWLTQHEVFVREKSGKPPPPEPPPPRTPRTPFEQLAKSSLSAGVGGAFLTQLYGNSENSQEFDRRVKDYLATLRDGMLAETVVRDIVVSEANKVYFSAGNMTDDPVSGVQLTVIIPKSGIGVFTDPPNVDPLPSMPKWRDPIHDQFASFPVGAMGAMPPFDPTAGLVTETSDAFEITWDVGNLRPDEWSPAYEVTVVAGPSAPSELEVVMIARAMDRRRTTTNKETLTIGADSWTVGDWYVARPDK